MVLEVVGLGIAISTQELRRSLHQLHPSRGKQNFEEMWDSPRSRNMTKVWRIKTIAVLSFGDKDLVVVAIVQQLGRVLRNKQIGSHTIMPRPRLRFCGRQANLLGVSASVLSKTAKDLFLIAAKLYQLIVMSAESGHTAPQSLFGCPFKNPPPKGV
jgi:hypothetical protein